MWRCTITAGGEPFVMTNGMILMQKWCVDSWAWGKKKSAAATHRMQDLSLYVVVRGELKAKPLLTD